MQSDYCKLLAATLLSVAKNRHPEKHSALEDAALGHNSLLLRHSLSQSGNSRLVWGGRGGGGSAESPLWYPPDLKAKYALF